MSKDFLDYYIQVSIFDSYQGVTSVLFQIYEIVIYVPSYLEYRSGSPS